MLLQLQKENDPKTSEGFIIYQGEVCYIKFEQEVIERFNTRKKVNDIEKLKRHKEDFRIF
jgi:hypothetical protein